MVKFCIIRKKPFIGKMRKLQSSVALVLTSIFLMSAACCQAGNELPTAYIDSIVPNVAAEGEEITFLGHGNDSDGSIVGWRWMSTVDGFLASASSFTSSSLSVGTHNISFEVRDNRGGWSDEAFAQILVGATANMDAAVDIALEEILPEIPEIKAGDPYICYKLRNSLYRGTTINEDTDAGLTITLNEEIFFFYLDLSPQDSYPHSVVYILVDSDGNHDEYGASWLPNINGDVPEELTTTPLGEKYLISRSP